MFLFQERTTTCVKYRKTTRKHCAYSEMTVRTHAHRAHIALPRVFIHTDKRMTSVQLRPSGFDPTPALTGGNALLLKNTQVCFTENAVTCGLTAIFTPFTHQESGIVFLGVSSNFCVIICGGPEQSVSDENVTLN